LRRYNEERDEIFKNQLEMVGRCMLTAVLKASMVSVLDTII
jgi:hypothetical protein